MEIDFRVTCAGVTFKNPLLAASANHVRGIENTARIIRSGVGGIVCKSVTELEQMRGSNRARFAILDEHHRPCKGNIPRMYTFYSRTGSMEEPDAWIRDLPAKLELAKAHDVVLIGSIAAGRPENWVEIARMMEKNGLPMIELNIGCPHYGRVDEKMGALIGQDPVACRELVRAVRSAVDVPLIVKLTPQAIDLMRIAEAVQEAGADALTMTNRFMGFAVDIENACPHTGSWAAVGGPWVKPLSLRWIAECYSNFSLPIFGSNGAADWSDVIEFMMAGSSFVQMAGALMLRGPDLIPEILTGMDAFLKRRSYRSVKEIIGVAARAAIPYNELHRTPVQRMRIVEEACIQCGDCMNACYYGAIKNEGGSITIGDGCMGCELCLAFCSVPGALATEPVQN